MAYMSFFGDFPPCFSENGYHFIRMDKVDKETFDTTLIANDGFIDFIGLADYTEDIEGDAISDRFSFLLSEDKSVTYLVQDADDQCAGCLTLNRHNIYPEKVNFAYYTFPDQRGKGVVVRMANAFLGYVFQQNLIDKVFCAIWESNFASLRSLEKLGFIYMGLKPSYIDPPPVVDHQFLMSRERFFSPERKETKFTLAREPDMSFKPK